MKPSIFEELYPSRFLKAALFKGGKPTLTIKDVFTEELTGDDGVAKVKAVVSFVERPMQLLACKTNGICLKNMFGNELKNWVGKRVTLFESQWNGEPCIRVWGSPDIAEDMKIAVTLPRRKPIPMVLHAVKVKKTAEGDSAAVDPRIATAWEVLGWTGEEGAADRAGFSGQDTQYLAHLNSLIDARNSQEK